MTTIAAGLPVRAATVEARKGDDRAADHEFVGKGSGFARFVGGTTGAAVGIGATIGLVGLASRSNAMPVRIGALVAGLGSIGGGAFLGQKLLGNATRQTAAEHSREASANREDLAIGYRIDVAEVSGVDRKKISEARKLQGERSLLAKAGPDQGFLGEWALPIAATLGAAVAVGMLAYKLSPDDGKGITAGFNGMFGMMGGGAAGLGIGIVAGDALLPGTRLAEVPAADAARISEIDARLDALIGPDAA